MENDTSKFSVIRKLNEDLIESKSPKKQKIAVIRACSLGSVIDSSSTSDSQFRLVTWNTDGLSSDTAEIRAHEISAILMELVPLPDAIFFQEVTLDTLNIFQSRLSANGYIDVFEGKYDSLSCHYFTMTLIRQSTLKNPIVSRLPYARSDMGRDLLYTTVSFNAWPFDLYNTHLESGKDTSEVRREQLCECLKRVRDSAVPALIAGDLNLRDTEAIKEPLVGELCDPWMSICGPKDRENKYTWDTIVNDNLGIDAKIRMRMDRVYMNSIASKDLKGFFLLGKERMLEGFFPSDHFGICLTFAV